MGAVIDKKAFTRIRNTSTMPGKREGAAGWHRERRTGYFVEPTLIETSDPVPPALRGSPVVTAHVYQDAKWEETLAIVDKTSPHGLTERCSPAIAQPSGRLERAAQRRRQLLHQRQAHRRGRRPAAAPAARARRARTTRPARS